MDIGKVVEIGDRKTPTPPLLEARTRPAMTASNASVPTPVKTEGSSDVRSGQPLACPT
jgi:hypothetical protein